MIPDRRPSSAPSPERTAFLYPFIDADERDAAGLVAELAVSARATMADSVAMRAATVDAWANEVACLGEAMAIRFQRGGRLLTCGNGGSATDAEGTVELFRKPPSGRPLAALSMVDDRAVLTALANDVGFDLTFSRQVIAHGRADDMVIGFSTSGDSRNVLLALEEASRLGLLTIGLSGHGGGAMAASAAIDHCLVVRSESVHRIQEAQDALVLAVWSAVRHHLEEGSGP